MFVSFSFIIPKGIKNKKILMSHNIYYVKKRFFNFVLSVDTYKITKPIIKPLRRIKIDITAFYLAKNQKIDNKKSLKGESKQSSVFVML